MTASRALFVLVITLASIKAQSVSVSVTNIPLNATRLVAVVDGGGVTSPLRNRLDVAAGTTSSTMNIGVPSGGPYRVRVIAFTAGETFAAVLRSGKASGISVGGGPAATSVTLGDITGSLDASTPSSGNAGTSAIFKANITDPGDFLAGVGSGRIWYSATAFTQNFYSSQGAGSITPIGSGTYQFSDRLTLPTSPGTLYYQFGDNNSAFDDPMGNEAPFLVWPNLETGSPLQQIAVSTGASGVSVVVNAAGCYSALVQGGRNHATTWTITPQIGTLNVVTMWVGITPSSISSGIDDQIDIACYIPSLSGSIPDSVILAATSTDNPTLMASITIDAHTGKPR